MSMFSLLNPVFCSHLLTAFVHFLWQGMLLLILAVIATLGLRHASVQTRYALWLTTLLMMAACPLINYGLLHPELTSSISIAPATVPPPSASSDELSLPAPGAGFAPYMARAPHGVSSFDQQSIWTGHTAPCIIGVYFAGVCVLLGRLTLGLWGGQRLRRCSQPIDEQSILVAFGRQAKVLGLHFTPAIAYCKSVFVPTVVGVLRPMVLLPFLLGAGLSPEQVEMLLAHELAHIRRHDHLVNLLQRVIEAMLFFHPAVWYVSRRIRIEREHCCDELALVGGGKRITYADSLLRMAELRLHGQPERLAHLALLGADGRHSALGGRITRLLSGSAGESLRLKRSWGLALAVLFTAFLSVACLVPKGPETRGPASETDGMVGTWFFNNPMGDDEQMSIFADGRVLVLYSNGHRDDVRMINNTIDVPEFKAQQVHMLLATDGSLLQMCDQYQGMAKVWKRIDLSPVTHLVRPLTTPPATQPAADSIKPRPEAPLASSGPISVLEVRRAVPADMARIHGIPLTDAIASRGLNPANSAEPFNVVVDLQVGEPLPKNHQLLCEVFDPAEAQDDRGVPIEAVVPNKTRLVRGLDNPQQSGQALLYLNVDNKDSRKIQLLRGKVSVVAVEAQSTVFEGDELRKPATHPLDDMSICLDDVKTTADGIRVRVTVVNPIEVAQDYADKPLRLNVQMLDSTNSSREPVNLKNSFRTRPYFDERQTRTAARFVEEYELLFAPLPEGASIKQLFCTITDQVDTSRTIPFEFHNLDLPE